MRKEIDLCVGDLAGAPPNRLLKVLRENIAHPDANHYPSPKGLGSTREAASAYYGVNQHVTIDPNDVAITHGARPAIFLALQVADRTRPVVGYFAPAYTAFAPLIAHAGLRQMPVLLPKGPVSKRVLEMLLAPIRGGVFIFNNPHNPTGRIFTVDEIITLRDVARVLDIRLISDFVYADLYEETPPVSLLAVEPKAIEIISISKPYRACGWRVGAVVGEPEWVARLAETYTALNGVPFAFQRAAAVAWSEMPEVADLRCDLVRRRDALISGLRKLSFTVNTELQNKSGMFVWAAIPNRFPSAAEVKKQLATFGVLLSDGADFGGDSNRHVRIALNEPLNVLSDALSLIDNAVKAYNERREVALPALGRDERAV